MSRVLIVAACLLVFAGCAAVPVAPAPVPRQHLWRDQDFNYDAAAVSVDRQSLFALDAELHARLEDSGIKAAGTQRRVDFLFSLLFGPDNREFPYAGDQSNIAAQTWRLRRGNCLSLSVLAYSMAKALKLQAELQEVRVPSTFDRHGRVVFVARHVNVLIKNDARLHLQNGTRTSGNVVIDFEPRVGWLRNGAILSEESVLARFYNNIAADHFAQDNLTLAYAWFKAAILADPAYASSYSNLAQLYNRAGHVDNAEQLLRHAIALNEEDDTPVRSLYHLLTSQGRDAEALKYANMMRARQETDPYYWLGLGMNYLKEASYPKAVSALEQAAALTSGFDEVHHYLALAYWYNGDQNGARKQLAVLGSLAVPGAARSSDIDHAALSRKLGRASAD